MTDFIEPTEAALGSLQCLVKRQPIRSAVQGYDVIRQIND